MADLNQLARSVPYLLDLLNQASGADDSGKIKIVIDVVNLIIKKLDEVVDHSDDVSEKWNKGRLQLREFTATPAVADMRTKEMSYSTDGYFYVKTDDNTISIFGRSVTQPPGGTVTVGGLPGGDNTDIQFNDNDVFGGDAGFTYQTLASISIQKDMKIIFDSNEGSDTYDRYNSTNDYREFYVDGSLRLQM